MLFNMCTNDKLIAISFTIVIQGVPVRRNYFHWFAVEIVREIWRCNLDTSRFG